MYLLLRLCTNFVLALVKQYNRRITTDSIALKTEVDEYMLNHDRLLKQNEISQKEREEEEAEDGWVTVGKK